MKFGRPVSPAQLGMYDPVEHIDKPTGTVNNDLLQNKLGGLDPGGKLRSGETTNIPMVGRGAFTTPERDLSPDAIGRLMKTNDAGVPEYIAQSREYVKDEIRAAIADKRTAEGLFHVGNFSHVVEDLFAHSNWIEVAVGDLIQSGAFTLEANSEAGKDVQKRLQLGQPPIETYAGNVAAHGREARPALMTGTFAPGSKGHDTFISLKAEVQNVLAGVEPFGPDGSTEKWWDFGLELLQNVEAAADAGNLGAIFADHVKQVVDNLGIGQKIKHFTGGLEHKARVHLRRGLPRRLGGRGRGPAARRGQRDRRRHRRGLGHRGAGGAQGGRRPARRPHGPGQGGVLRQARRRGDRTGLGRGQEGGHQAAGRDPREAAARADEGGGGVQEEAAGAAHRRLQAGRPDPDGRSGGRDQRH
jgi:hypothetical protein